MPSNADIYATLLYAPCEGLPLWNPSTLELGDVGFLRDGSFHVLYNAIKGPPAVDTFSDATRADLAMRTAAPGLGAPTNPSASVPPTPPFGDGTAVGSRKASNASMLSMGSSSSSGKSDPGAVAAGHQQQQPGTIPISPPAGSPSTTTSGPASRPMSHSNSSPGQNAFPRRSSLTLSRNLLRRSASPPAPLPGYHGGGSPQGSSGATPSGAGPSQGSYDDLRPPLPLSVDQETPRVFTMGPRTSNNMRSLGVDFGAQVTGSPVGGTVSFETSGGDGALLIPRDPVQRTLLKHVGVLKAYVKAHRRWIFETFGEAEDMDVDEIALIYGQDRTSDWAVSVSRDAAHGSKLAFEVFSVGKSSVWGSWKESSSASQRGPYRDGSQYRDLAVGAGAPASGPDPDAAPVASSNASAKRGKRNSTPSAAKTSSPPPSPGVTTRSQAARAAASAGGPSGPAGNSTNGHAAAGMGAVVPMDIDTEIAGVKVGFTLNPAGNGDAQGAALNEDHGLDKSALQINVGFGSEWEWSKFNPFPRDQSIILRRITAKNRLGLGFLPARMKASGGPRKDGPDDPRSPEDIQPVASVPRRTRESPDMEDALSILHEIMQEMEPTARVSIASDADAMALLSKAQIDIVLQGDASSDVTSLASVLRWAAERWLDVSVDTEGFAQPNVREEPRAPVHNNGRRVESLGTHPRLGSLLQKILRVPWPVLALPKRLKTEKTWTRRFPQPPKYRARRRAW